MALASKGFTTPPPIEPGGPGPNIPEKSSPIKKGSLPGKRRSIIREEIVAPATQVLRNVIFPKKSMKKEKEKTSEERPGVFDTLLGLTPKRKKTAISPKTKSSLFGKERVIKDAEFEKFLKSPSLYKIDQLSARQRGQAWRKEFPRTGSGYVRRQDIKMAYKKLTHTRPKTLKEAYLRKRKIRISYRDFYGKPWCRI